MKSSSLALLLCAAAIFAASQVSACRVGSEKLKSYTRKSVERFLDTKFLESIYWPEEPLNAAALSKATGINVTLAETRFNLGGQSSVEKDSSRNDISAPRPSLVYDIFVTCSADRDRVYTLTINLELNNPFKVVDLRFRRRQNATDGQEDGLFRIRLPRSTFIVQLNQRISYDECLDVKYVQLSPTVAYEVECVGCTESEQAHLDRIFSKRMTQLDAELDSMLSEKLLLGLQSLLNQQRLDLDLYLN